MPYQIDRYNGTFFSEVPDQTVDTSSCDLKLIGKNYAGYGEVQNENFLFLLENFRGLTAPRRPIPGQIWYDEATNKIKFRDSTAVWRTLAVTDVSGTAPSGLAERDKGNLWYNDALQQINVWDGTEFVTVGPEVSVGFGETRLRSGTVRDNGNTEHAIIKIFANNQVIGVISADEFEIGVIETITGFTTVKKGITLVNTPSTGITSSTHRFWGTAGNSEKFANRDVSQFVLRGESGSAFDDTGFAVGNDNDLKIYVDPVSDDPVLENQLGNSITVRIRTGNVNDDIARFESDGVFPGRSEWYDIGSNTFRYKSIYSKDFYGNLIGSFTGNVRANDSTILVDSVLKRFNGETRGVHEGNVRDNSGGTVFNSATRAFAGTSAEFTTASINTLTVIDRIVGAVKGDLFDNNNAIAYNSVSGVFTGSLQGNAATASKLAGTIQINGVSFDGSSNITVIDSAAVPKAGGSMTGPLTLVGTPVAPNQAATKAYVDEQILRKTLYFSLDVKGLDVVNSGSGTVVALLNSLAPPWTLADGTRAQISSTIQNVTSTASAPTGSFIGRSFVTSVTVTTTVNNPTRNNLLVYVIDGNTWKYVSG
jgi:hypothetical protein